MNSQRTALLVLVLLLIGVSIWYLDSQKAHPSGLTGPAADVATSSVHSAGYAQNKLTYEPAKELVAPQGFINTGGAPITISQFVGNKVVLLDFWTYSCINCQRTIPYLEAWYQKYKDYGFVIIGIHTPEFGFEKVLSNVEAAVAKLGITYPVVLDSNQTTWDAYNNEYWPAGYLIDIDGLVREKTIGEGGYQDTEANIQKLLQERADTLHTGQVIPTGFVDINKPIDTSSPETYFGAARNEYLGNGRQGQGGEQTLTAPQNPMLNTLYLDGTWNFADEYAENVGAAKIIYHYSATSVYLVASSDVGVTLTVYVDGKLISADKGADVDAQGQVHVKEARLYKIIEGTTKEEHTIELRIAQPGLDAYTFTFG